MKQKSVCLRGYLRVFGDVLLKGPLMRGPNAIEYIRVQNARR